MKTVRSIGQTAGTETRALTPASLGLWSLLVCPVEGHGRSHLFGRHRGREKFRLRRLQPYGCADSRLSGVCLFPSAVRVTSRTIYAASSYSLLLYISFDSCRTSYVHRRPFTDNAHKGLYEGTSCTRISLSILLGQIAVSYSKRGEKGKIWT